MSYITIDGIPICTIIDQIREEVNREIICQPNPDKGIIWIKELKSRGYVGAKLVEGYCPYSETRTLLQIGEPT